LARKLGATVAGTVPDYSAGAFGMEALANTLRERLEPSVGKRPGCPSNPAWSKRPKVPMAPETEQRLKELANLLSEGEKFSSIPVRFILSEPGIELRLSPRKTVIHDHGCSRARFLSDDARQNSALRIEPQLSGWRPSYYDPWRIDDSVQTFTLQPNLEDA
jgi:hypothetical protein